MGMEFSRDEVARIAQAVLGTHNTKLSSQHELRFGNHGSMSVDLRKGTWHDHEVNEGGGLVALIEREKGLKGKNAIAFMRECGVDVPDNQPVNGAARSYKGESDGSTVRKAGDKQDMGELTASFDYVDEGGNVLFQVCRYERDEIGKDGKNAKTFRQRKPDGKGGWTFSVKGVRQVPYQLPSLIEAVAEDYTVFIAEGEKAVEALRRAGVPATCNAGGSGKWPDELTPFFAGADVVILPDDDPQARNPKDGKLKFNDDGSPHFPGMDHARLVASKLEGVARRIRVLSLFDRQKKEDAADWIDQGGTADLLYDLVEKDARLWPFPPSYVSRFNAVPWHSLDNPGPKHEWLVKGILTRGERSLVVGPSGSGKSFLAIDMAMAIARGEEYYNNRVHRGGVVYQAGEGSLGIRKRIKAYMDAHSLSVKDDVPFVLLPSALDLYGSEDHTNLLIAEVKHWASTFDVPLELVVIDTLSAATPGANENDSGDVSRVLTRCARIAHECRCHVMLVHHMNAQGTKERGHSSIRANLDSIIKVERLDDLTDTNNRRIHVAKLTKQKDGEDNLEWRFVLRQRTTGYDDYGDAITSCVVERPATGESGDGETGVRPARLKPGSNVRSVFEALTKALKKYGDVPPQGVRADRNTITVSVDTWRNEFKRTVERFADDTDDKYEGRVRQAFHRGMKQLEAVKVTKMDTPKEGEASIVWLSGRPVEGFKIDTLARMSDESESEESPIDTEVSALDDEVPF